MEKQEILVKDITGNFKKELASLYDPNELNQIIYTLFSEFLGWTRPMIHMQLETPVSPGNHKRFVNALSELKNHRPIQYIIGKSWFDGLELNINESALIPRPETEELCNLIKIENSNRNYQEFSILDIGTGSGVISIDLALFFSYSRITAIDLSQDALVLAKQNADRYHCNIVFHQMDLLDPAETADLAMFDMIVSNPPYVMESEKRLMHRNVLDFEPPIALFVPDDEPLIFYQAITRLARTKLANPGLLYLEINEKFGRAISQLLQSSGFEKVAIVKDIHGKDRFVRAEKRMTMLDTSYWYADQPENP